MCIELIFPTLVTEVVAPVLRAYFSLSVCNLELFYVVIRRSIEARESSFYLDTHPYSR